MTRLKKEYDNLPPDTPEIERLSRALDKVLEGKGLSIPEARNIKAVDMKGDQSVLITFQSCRSASAFWRAVLEAAPQLTEGGE